MKDKIVKWLADLNADIKKAKDPREVEYLTGQVKALTWVLAEHKKGRK